jgi:sRNA-binding protein
MGWSLPYTLGVLTRWKMSAVYCQAVLSHDRRIGLDGSPAEMVDAEARELATKQRAQLEARKAAAAIAGGNCDTALRQNHVPLMRAARSPFEVGQMNIDRIT